jgi:hypothetical protein
MDWLGEVRVIKHVVSGSTDSKVHAFTDAKVFANSEIAVEVFGTAEVLKFRSRNDANRARLSTLSQRD